MSTDRIFLLLIPLFDSSPAFGQRHVRELIKHCRFLFIYFLNPRSARCTIGNWALKISQVFSSSVVSVSDFFFFLGGARRPIKYGFSRQQPPFPCKLLELPRVH